MKQVRRKFGASSKHKPNFEEMNYDLHDDEVDNERRR